MYFNPCDKLLESPAQGHGLRAKNQLVQVLSVVGLHGQAGMYVLVDEHVVEHHKTWQCVIPRVVLEDRRWRPSAAFDDDMRRMLGREPPPLRDRHRIPRGQGAQHRRQSRLPPPVLRIDEGKTSEGDSGAGAYRIELPDVPKKPNADDHAARRLAQDQSCMCLVGSV